MARQPRAFRMRFDDEDGQAFAARRDELGEQFARWLATRKVAGDPDDARLLMDWKFRYGDGALDLWTVGDVEEFLLDWCVRKLLAPPEDCAEMPLSVAAFGEFLAATGLLGSGSDPPAKVRRFCEQNTTRFVQEMANPVNSRLARSMVAFGEAPEDPEVAAVLQRLFEDDEDDEAVVGPVRLPTEPERRQALRAAAVPRQLRLLAEFYAPPGRPLTGTGNLRLADARHLVAALETGDDPELGGHRRLASAEDLPTLSWLFGLAVDAGVVRRTQGRLRAVAKFAALEEAEAFAKVVRAAVAAGLVERPYWSTSDLDLARATANEAVVGLLADLLDAGADGVERDALVQTTTELLEDVPVGIPPVVARSVPGWVSLQLRRLAALGMVTVDGSQVALTAAGVPVAVELVRDAGVGVLLRPDPATADAAALADLVGWLDEQEWADDVTAWLAAQTDRAAAVDRLVAEVCAERQDSIAVMAGLAAVGRLAGDETVAAARQQLEGPHDGLVVNWLAARSAIDLSTIDPLRHFSGLVDVFAVVLDTDGPEATVAAFAQGDQAMQLDLLDRVWRLRHPRLPDVLDAIGAHHPVEAVAKAARRAVIRHRSWLVDPSTR